MIIDNIPNFIQRIIKNSEDDFYTVVHGCRQCGYSGNLHRHACYFRTVICKEITARVRIQRVKCPDCGKTHAIIPSDLIPYYQHTLSTILDLLELIKVNKHSYSMVVNRFKKFNPSFSIAHINQYIRRFESNFKTISYYFRNYLHSFSDPPISEASIVIESVNKYPLIFNTNYFKNMPSYFLSKIH